MKLGRTFSTAFLLLGLTLLDIGAAAAREAHGLLMWVGRYGSPELDLPGIDFDASRAREIAAAYGVRPDQRIEVGEEALSLPGMVDAFALLEARVRPGDRVFIYFSGHGRQIDGQALGVRCSEGLVTQDAGLFLDVALERTLTRLAERAGEVVMFNDSCHAGGAAAKSWSGERAPGEVAKVFPGVLRSTFGRESSPACGQAVNKSAMTLFAPGRVGHPQRRWLHVAAAAADEIAYAGPEGSRATRAWHACLVGERSSAGRAVGSSGGMDGEALRRCAQAVLDGGRGKRQTITLQGDAGIRLR